MWGSVSFLMFQQQSYMRECGRVGNYRLDSYRSKQRLEEKEKAIRKNNNNKHCTEIRRAY